MKYLALILFVFSLLLSPVGLWAEEPAEFDSITARLGLTEKQKLDLKVVYAKHGEKEEELQVKLRIESADLREELQKPDTRRSKVKRIASKINITNKKLLDNRINEILATKEILTPGQYTRLQVIRQTAQLERQERLNELRQKIEERKKEQENKD